MRRISSSISRLFALIGAFALACPDVATAAKLLLKDGRTLEGRYVLLSSVAENPLSPSSSGGEVAVTSLLMVDDGLRRTYLRNEQVKEILDQNNPRDVKINIWQPVAERGGGVGRIGRATKISPFDEWGRRIYEMQSTEGPLSVVQGITQVTPLYTKVEGLTGGARSIVWDMRIATSSIPRDVLTRVLTKSLKKEDLEGRLQLVRLYMESERYRDAGNELEEVLKDFPERDDLKQDIRQLRQLGAQLILREVKRRAAAGQHQRAQAVLTQFPTEGVSGETLQEVRELLAKYETETAGRKKLIDELNAQVAKIADENGRALAEGFAKEISTEVNEDAIKRLASFERLADDTTLTPEQKVALAVSGWLVGANQATDSFQIAVSLAHARDTVRAYLREPLPQKRVQLAGDLHDMEGASIDRIAQILKLMRPPLDVPKDSQRGPLTFEFTTPGIEGSGDVRYLVQLPPEYDPLRYYPTIVTLGDAGISPEQMLDFWAGPMDKERGSERLGQATRQGYIVIAVDWQAPHQYSYDYSAREHRTVLGPLRDGCRRFSIDIDRVFLTGHGMGGDAVWDIAIAHPDVWAGVLPIVATADRFVSRYAKNAEYVPWYVVAGELDADKLARNATQLDRYLRPNADVTVVEYLGRGYEPFSDEIQRMFDWMGRRKRMMPKEFEYITLRPSDNFFWWVEVEGLPEKSMVVPANWPPPKGVRPFQFDSKVGTTNRVTVNARAKKATVWLSPELVDFNQQMVVEVNNHSLQPRDRMVRPDTNVLLEDVRTRADRQHPFWAKLSTGE